MIILHTYGPHWGLPDANPFVTKAEILLRMANVSHKAEVGNLETAPKGILPFIEDNGLRIADATFIRIHLENKYLVDFDKGLSNADRAVAWSFEKLCEAHLHWLILEARWMNPENFTSNTAELFAKISPWKRFWITRKVSKQVKAALWFQGTARHERGELSQLAERDLNALAAFLGNKQYLMGNHVCGADASVFAFLLAAMCPKFKTPLRAFAESHANLRSYCGRMMRKYYPELSTVEEIPLLKTPVEPPTVDGPVVDAPELDFA